MPKYVILVDLLILAGAYFCAIESADSDYTAKGFAMFIGGPLFLFVGFRAASQAIGSLRSHTVRGRTLGVLTASVLLASSVVYGGVWYWLHPANIHYTFDYGRSETWQEVQFTHTVNGKEIKGPWVGGFPLCVRFPDINNDGYRDIRVIGNGPDDIVEYIYLPQNDGNCFWHLLKSSVLGRSYPPDGQPSTP